MQYAIEMYFDGATEQALLALPNQWVPHCTLALTQDDPDGAFYRASDLLLHEFKKISGRFVSIGLVKVTFPVKEIYTVELES